MRYEAESALPGRLYAVLRGAMVVSALATLGACAETQLAVHTAKTMVGTTESSVTPRGTYKVGQPYQINGTWYRPEENWTYREEGVASWYGEAFHGKATANGEAYDMNALTAAHRTLPMPSLVRVTNLENGRSVVLRVNDRGPFAKNRIIDVSRRGAQLLDFHRQGVTEVRVEVLAEESRVLRTSMLGGGNAAPPLVGQVASMPTAVAPAPALKPIPVGLSTASSLPQQADAPGPGIWVQAGAFSDAGNADRVRQSLQGVAAISVSPVQVNGVDLFRVRLGPLQDTAEAERVLALVRSMGFSGARPVND
jgi:rare lipoprotein A